MGNADPQPDYGNGKICYIVIPAEDIATSAAFYEKTFGWKVRRRGDGSTAFDYGVGQVSGSWETGKKRHIDSGLMISIMVDDIEAAVETVIANGGKIVQPIGMEAPEMTAHFSDPAGNIFGLYQEPTLAKK